MSVFKELRGPERLMRMGQWGIALLFAYFLTQIGASLIADLPLISKEPVIEDFLDQNAIARQNQLLKPLQASEAKLNHSLSENQDALSEAQSDYEKAKASFDNWRETRSSTEQSDQNPEVVKRTHELDALLKTEKDLEQKQNDLNKQVADVQAQMQPMQTALNRIQADAEIRLDTALYKASLKSFFIRLAFVGPLLLIAIWLFRRHRQSNKWPFVWGFILFALASFFIELVPYLPSFGGYIRYGVGALLTFFGGTALIRALQRYLERKRQEQAASQETRKESIRYEEALTAMTRNQCPSCDRKLVKIEEGKLSYCMHCGLQLYVECPHCGQRRNAFFHFCPNCGDGADTPATKDPKNQVAH
jgi:predicted RNA-binding Zn-ribbon protein involved in translation (DUF1610 family)